MGSCRSKDRHQGSTHRPKLATWRLVAFLLCLVLASAAHAQGRRVALVIGNGNYQHAPKLDNPVNDANGVAAALAGLGFEVEKGIDLDIGGFRKIVRSFADRLNGADVGLFFYAGHGLQVGGRNYLAPVDANLTDEADLHFETIELDVILDLLEDPDRTALVFLDACRDNPLARSLARSMGASRSLVGSGLARVDTGIGTLIAFATAPGDVAYDGNSQHSPFTGALLSYIDTPGIEVRQMLSRVRDQVYRETGGKQLPWDNSSLRADFYFNPEKEAPKPEVAAVQPTTPAPSGERSVSSAEVVFWQSIEKSDNPTEFQEFLQQFPNGVFAGLAKTRLAALEAEESAPPAVAPQRAPPAPAPEVAIQIMDVDYTAAQTSNMRAAPNVDAEKLGTLAAGTRVTVRGKVEGADWYQIERPDGSGIAYVYAPLLAPLAPAKTAALRETPAVPTEPAPLPARPAPTAPPAASKPKETAQVTVAPHAALPGEADAGALATRIADQWGTRRYRYGESQGRGRPSCTGLVTIAKWEPARAQDAVVGLAGSGGPKAVRGYKSFAAEAELVVFVEHRALSVIEYKRLDASSSGWCLERAPGDAAFVSLVANSGELTAASSDVASHNWDTVSGFTFSHAIVEAADGDAKRACLVFMGTKRDDRLDGIMCQPPGVAIDPGDVESMLGRIRVEGVLG